MSFDLNYGKRIGVVTFKSLAKELCEATRKFEPLIRAYIANPANGVSAGDQALIVALINAIDAACSAVTALHV